MWACWAGIVKGAGMPCLKMPVFLNRRNLWMGQRACVWFWWCVCLYCVNVCVWLWVVGQKLTVKVHPSPRREPYSMFQAFSEHPHLLECLLLLDVSSVRPCLDASAWHCTMSGRSLVGHEPGVLQARWKTEEEARFQRNPVSAWIRFPYTACSGG